jgi:rare lipoprotein A
VVAAQLPKNLCKFESSNFWAQDLNRYAFKPGSRGAVAAVLGITLAATACTTTPAPPPYVPVEEPLPVTGQPIYKIGEPYQVAGIWYYPREQPDYDETGIASWYGEQFHGRLTANGEIFDRNQISAAHPTLPMPVNARVTNLENGRSLVVRINDRGPFVNGRIIDLSEHAAQLLGYYEQGTARVRVTFLGRAELYGADTLLAGEGTPPEIATAVPAAPTTVIASGELAPVQGAGVAPDRPVEALPQQAPAAPIDVNLPSVDGQVTAVPVPPATAIYVQAGAFEDFMNAARIAARLAFAGAQISQTERDGRPLYRVRMGPFQDVGVADAVLAQVQATGHNDVGIVVD